MMLARKAVAIPFSVLQGIGFVFWVASSIFLIGWYIEWLDQYFLWHAFANILGIFTVPVVPLAIIIEWLWHAWPADITIGFVLNTLGLLLWYFGLFVKNRIAERT